MGNRCLIVPKGQENLGVYLHWNGGVDSVTAFLEYCKIKGYRPFGGKSADGYGIARFIQVVGNFFGGSLSIGIEAITEKITDVYAKSYDNGIYIIDGWEICKRICPSGHEGYDLKEMLIDIDKAQPTEEQLGEDYLRAEEVETADLEIGDRVYVMDYNGKVEPYIIQGFADNSNSNRPFIGSPYINKHNEVNGKINPNNFLTGKVRRVKAE